MHLPRVFETVEVLESIGYWDHLSYQVVIKKSQRKFLHQLDWMDSI